MQIFSSIRRFAITGATVSLLLTACQEGELSSYQEITYQDMAKPLAQQSAEPLLGEPPVFSDEWAYGASHDPQYAWRVPSSNTGGWSVNATNRQLARAFYNSVYSASLNTPIEWTGNHAGCVAGTTGSDFKNSVLARINYFRAMAGVPANITLDSTYNVKAQQAALMMSANDDLDHYPSNTWGCYTDDGYTAAGKSNISLGHNGWDAVGGQIRDNGSNNTAVGHRRWLLLPQTQRMGTGDVPASGSFSPANAVWVFDGNTYAARPATRDDFVAWPTKGFNPYQVVPVRWSFSYPGASFTNATVTMTQNGANVPLAVEPLASDMGEPTLVWRPNNLTANQNWPKPNSDTTYQVNINNVVVGGQSRNFSYPVTVIDPQALGASEEQAHISGSASPTAGTPATYSFDAVSIAQQYEAYVAEIAAATGVYNAESNSLSVTDGTDSSYTLVYSGSGSNGTNVYRLAHSTEYALSETVEFADIYIPSSDSVLTFDSKLGYATDKQTAVLQISVDNGVSWKDIYSRIGVNGVTESSFSGKSVSLSAYAGQLIKLRAEYRFTGSGSLYTGTSANVSFLLDNVQVTNAQKVVSASTQNTGSNTSFGFTPVSGKQYALAARAIPWIGYPGLEWGALFYAEAADNNADTTPDAFSFTAQTNVARSSEMTSNSITVSGINTAAAISVSGGSYSINNGAFTTTPGLVSNGNTVRVRHTSSANYTTQVNSTLTIGGVSASFSSTTVAAPEDTTPDAFSFTAQTNVARSSEMTSNSITVSGINTAAAISMSGGSYSINNGAFTTTPGLVSNGNTVRVRHTSSANYATQVNSTLTIGGVAATFSSTTMAEPAAMVFTAQTNVQPSTAIESNTITVSGLTAAAQLSITSGEYSKNGAAYTKAKGAVQNGDTLKVRHTSSSRSNTTVTTTLKLGTQSLTFKSTTLVIDSVPDVFSFTALTDAAPSSQQTSNSITLSSMNSVATLTISGGEYSINGGAYTKTAGKAKAGDTIQVRHTSSAKSATAVNTTLTVGGVRGVFTSKTLVFDTIPDTFSFAAQTGVAKKTSVFSEVVNITGINVPVAISVSGAGGAYSINDGAFVTAKGIIKAGDKLKVRHLSSTSPNRTVTATVKVGGSTVTFKSTTLP